jgi:hypothetical protein
VDEIDNAMPRECSHRHPESQFETGDCECDEDRSSKRLENERVRGLSHDSEQRIEGGDHDRHDWIECSVAIESDASGEQPHEKGEYCSDD